MEKGNKPTADQLAAAKAIMNERGIPADKNSILAFARNTTNALIIAARKATMSGKDKIKVYGRDD